jgi:hypothetical protein
VTKPAKRIGRPIKAPGKSERVSLGLRVTAVIKRHIDAAARASGRTQSQEAEILIERALTYDDLLQAMHTTLANVTKGNVEAAFRSAGYRWIHTAYGKIWVPKEYPLKQIRGFIPADEQKQ